MSLPRFEVRIAPEAGDDLRRLNDFLLDKDAGAAERMLTVIDHAFGTLALSPHTCRRCEADPRLRELVIGFGHAGYVALFSIEPEGVVQVLAVRHQRESDYH